ncbi:MAG: tetratricopeptide repeat protein, partial [Dolichospermum sp.]
MKWQLLTHKQRQINQAFTIAMLTIVSGIICISCSNNQDILVTERSATIPNRKIGKTSKYAEFYIQGQTQHFKGNYQAAIAAYSTSIKLNPEYAPAFKGRGLVYFDTGNKEGAIADYNQVLRLNANDAETYNNRGNAFSSIGDYRRAIADYNQAISIKPKSAEFYNNRGNARANQGDKNGALEDYTQAIRI